MTTVGGPDFSHSGELFDWTSAELDERFPPLIEQARQNIGRNVELFRYDADQADAAQIASWWSKQQAAARRHIGSTDTVKVVVGCRMDKEIGVKRGYVRFDAKKAKRQAVAS